MTSRAIKVVVRDLNGFVERTVKRIALNVVANLQEDTPVDTGWARANWIPQIGSPFEGTAGTRTAAEAGNVDQATQAFGIAQVATGYRLGPPIYITNNVPYIETLNEGSSSQAPAAFVQAAILRAVRDTVARAG